ncbi:MULTISPECIES: lipase family protein [Paenibacillus]|uniref:Lipase n=1 Tax=Paenibacillus campinasensis TaxID=66347 RepID=A0A268ERT5_9BACL|nr:lipase family protein [Paenibacillus campinasensis]MUG66316.1 lipase family protein [Paenibacillus campinasensis]PAD75819.1 lipase [Paenibacillus campinasensis]
MKLNTAQTQRAIFLAAVCGQTYMQFSNQDGRFVLPANYTLFDTIEAQSLIGIWERFGYIIQSDQEIIIAFRGTSSAPNWIADVIASQRKFKYVQENVLTHAGFTGIYNSARKQIKSALRRLSKDKALFITGHSLGAALAVLCAVDVAANTARVPVLFTYGSPRIGDPAFAQAFKRYVPNSYRIASTFDPVTYAPPSIYKLPKRDKAYYYSHVPTLIPLDFLKGSISGNHVIGSYYAELAKLDPQFSEKLREANPGLCPVE